MAEKNNGPNWESIKMEYISTDISMRKLAEKHGMKADAIFKRAKRENWTGLREEANRRATAKLLQKAANQRAKLMAMGQGIGADLLKKVKFISDSAAKQKSTKTRSDTVTVKHVEQLGIDVPIHAITETDLTKLAGMYAPIMRTLGLDEASQIARDRLEIDRRKVELMIDTDEQADERPLIIDSRPEAEEDDAE